MNGKGSKPRNCFSKQFRNNYDEIRWGRKFCGAVEVTLVMGFLPKDRQGILPILYRRPADQAKKDLTKADLESTIVKHRKVKAPKHS